MNTEIIPYQIIKSSLNSFIYSLKINVSRWAIDTICHEDGTIFTRDDFLEDFIFLIIVQKTYSNIKTSDRCYIIIITRRRILKSFSTPAYSERLSIYFIHFHRSIFTLFPITLSFPVLDMSVTSFIFLNQIFLFPNVYRLGPVWISRSVLQRTCRLHGSTAVPQARLPPPCRPFDNKVWPLGPIERSSRWSAARSVHFNGSPLCVRRRAFNKVRFRFHCAARYLSPRNTPINRRNASVQRMFVY